MSDHKRVVRAYMDAYARFDRATIGALLTDDVRWDVPGAFHIQGRDAFDAHIVDPYSDGPPQITITRLTEEDGVVIAEGRVRAARTDGSVVRLEYCDVFEMRDGKIARLISYLAPDDTAPSAGGGA
ncbi:MAG: nuclear transport factor 2 family protein [Dehalococcoidia bacterium]